MDEIQKTFDFGKVDFCGCGRRINRMTVEVRLDYKDGDKTKPCFAVSGDVWNSKNTDIIAGGQCLDEMNKYLRGNATWNKIYRLWKLYHLNDMHPGTKKQEDAVEEHFGENWTYDYDKVKAYLQEIGLYDDGGNKYGHSWYYREIPSDDLAIIKSLLDIT